MENIALQIIITVVALVISWMVANALCGKKDEVKFIPIPPAIPYQPKEVEPAIKEPCRHEWDIESKHKSQMEIRPLNAFHDTFYVDSLVIARRCKKCKWHEVTERRI